MLFFLLACAVTDLDTSGDTSAPEPSVAAESAAFVPPPACEGLLLPAGPVVLERGPWAMLTASGCATGARVRCPSWVTVDPLPSDPVTGDVLLLSAGLTAMDGQPRVGTCAVRTDQGAVEVSVVWPG